MRRLRWLTPALLMATPGGTAWATEGGSGAYLLGSRDSVPGIVPPPGTYTSVDTFHLDGNVDFLAIGGAVLTDVHADLWISKINMTHSFEGNVLGGRPAVTVTLPVVTGNIAFRGDLVQQDLNLRFKDSDTGLSDVIVNPMLGWDEGINHYSIAVSIFLPTGFYDPTSVDFQNRQIQALSFGKNRVAVDPTFSFTHLNPKTGLEFSAALGVTISAENKETDYQTAPEMHLEAAAMQHLPGGLALGAAGYWYQQFGDDSGPGAESFRQAVGAKSLEARVFGVGPIVTYQTRVGKHSLSGKLKYYHEFEARRRLESEVISFTLAFGF
ncbi:hypothetical protein EDF58_10886 [Novosphingobium sp. PhB57]|nr:hypothetical protein EDF58_10886 [Novosphingobium sp. PhB57]